jgi:hypothetical protein
VKGVCRSRAALYAAVLGLLLTSAPALAVKEYLPKPAGSFGGTGSGNGQFDEPGAVAVNDSTEALTDPAAGNVYVVDKTAPEAGLGPSRVERFSSTGTYLGQFNGSGSYEAEGKAETGPVTPAGSFESGERGGPGIAVDDSGSALDPSLGDVYVADTGHGFIDKFNADGKYLTCIGPTACPTTRTFGEVRSIAVDPHGNLWVYEREPSSGEGSIDEFGDTGSFIKTLSTNRTTGKGAIAVDSTYIYVTNAFGPETVIKYEAATGKEVAILEPHSETTALTSNFTTDNLLFDGTSQLALYGAFAEPSSPIETFPSEPEPLLENSVGVAVNSVSGTTYATQRTSSNVELFVLGVFPTTTTGEPEEPTETSQVLHGTVNPEGESLTKCQFEYVSSNEYEPSELDPYAKGHSVACEQGLGTGNGEIGSGSTPITVSAEIKNLQVRTLYHFRLSATNANGTTHGVDHTLYTGVAPLVEEGSIQHVLATGATVTASVNPRRPGEHLSRRVRNDDGVWLLYPRSLCRGGVVCRWCPRQADGFAASIRLPRARHLAQPVWQRRRPGSDVHHAGGWRSDDIGPARRACLRARFVSREWR